MSRGAGTPPRAKEEKMAPRARRRKPLMLAGGALLALPGLVLLARTTTASRPLAPAAPPVAVTAVSARLTLFTPTHRYVGTILPWVEAKVGPQFVSAYVDTVLVRPGDRVRRGQVIGTLDCRNASAASKAIAMQARAIASQQQAISDEASRIAQLEHGGFASANDIEKKRADSASKEAELMSTQADLTRASLGVRDCVLRAPFDGEVAERLMDPGAYARPGQAIASIVDRTTVRVAVDIPEEDFALVNPGVSVDITALASGQRRTGPVARRSPAADPSTRTVHFEVDLHDPQRSLPVGTTAVASVAAGKPVPSLALPLSAAVLKGDKALVFVADGGSARKATASVLGQSQGTLFIKPAPELVDGALVVTVGRSLLKDGDRLAVKVDRLLPLAAADSSKP